MSIFPSFRKWFRRPNQSPIQTRIKNLHKKHLKKMQLERLEDRLAPATTRWVDNTPGTGDTEFTATGGTQAASLPVLTLGVDLFTTISAAVAAASAGDIIDVSDGTYSELGVVTKTLTIQGNQFGVDPRAGRSGGESIVDNGDGDFQILADSVVIDGFTVQGAVNDSSLLPFTSLGAGIWTNPAFSGTAGGHQIRNN